MTTLRIRLNEKKGFFILILFIVLGLKSLSTHAQSFQKELPFYRGFEVSFGTRSFTLQSNIPELSSLPVLQQGGQLGIVFGNKIVRTKLGIAGFYYSAGSTPRTVDLFESDASLHFYPLNLYGVSKSKIVPYLISGINYGRLDFSGFYLLRDQPVNYSTSSEPFLGNLHVVRATVGTGVEVKLIDRFDFVHLFAEIKYGVSASSSTKYSDFKSTTPGNQLSANIGVRFGAFR